MPGIVIGGAPRSGTTLILSVLSSSPLVHAVPHETYALVAEEPEVPERLRRLLGERWNELWVEKTPLNVRNIERILAVLPDARFIHVVRDGRDVVTSRFPGHSHYEVFPGGWATDVERGLALRDHPRVLTLLYEDFVHDYPASGERLFDWLGLPFHDEYPKKATVLWSQAWTHAARPVHDESVGRWRLPEHAERVKEFQHDENAMRVHALVEELRAERQAHHRTLIAQKETP